MLDYDSIAESYNELHGEEQENKLAVIKKNIQISRKTKILDVGCGTGISSDFGCFVVGIDPSFGLLKYNRHLKILGAAEALPFKNNSFDHVISVTSMHNFSDIVHSINEMKRVGKKSFVFSILKKTKKFDAIGKALENNFKISKEIEEEKDIIFLCTKKHKVYIEKITTI